MGDKKLLSIVVPVYFEEKGLHEFYRRTINVMKEMSEQCDYELIMVNDGSTDNSWKILKELASIDSKVKIINLSRNFGHQLAITAGMDFVCGDVIVVIDDDLQDPPEVIKEMYNKWLEGFHVVYGVRKKRKGEKVWKLFTAKIFYKLLSILSDVDLPVNAGDFRLMDRKVVEALKGIREENRYIRGLISWIGFNQYGLQYDRDSRFAGKTTYNFRKLFKFAFDGILSFSDKPLKLVSYLGFVTTIISFILALNIIIGKLISPIGSISQGWTSTILIILFVGGIQLISTGIIGQYISRIYSEVKKRPLYIISEKIGIDVSKQEKK